MSAAGGPFIQYLVVSSTIHCLLCKSWNTLSKKKKMESFYSLVAILFSIFLVIWGWRMLNWAWFSPKKLEKCLREQGLRGTPYKFMFGDMKESVKMDEEARSKPMNLTNDIVPRVLPFYRKAIKEHGMFYLS